MKLINVITLGVPTIKDAIGRAESQRLAQSNHRGRRGENILPDRYSLPSGIYQREDCLELRFHKGFHKRLHKRKAPASI